MMDLWDPDWYTATASGCQDCVNSTTRTSLRVVRGSRYDTDVDRVVERSADDIGNTYNYPIHGVRYARDP